MTGLPLAVDLAIRLSSFRPANRMIDADKLVRLSPPLASRLARRRAQAEGLLPTPSHEDRLMAWLDRVEGRLRFSRWYMGHYHRDLDLDGRHAILYHRLVRLGDPAGGGSRQ